MNDVRRISLSSRRTSEQSLREGVGGGQCSCSTLCLAPITRKTHLFEHHCSREQCFPGQRGSAKHLSPVLRHVLLGCARRCTEWPALGYLNSDPTAANALHRAHAALREAQAHNAAQQRELSWPQGNQSSSTSTVLVARSRVRQQAAEGQSLALWQALLGASASVRHSVDCVARPGAGVGAREFAISLAAVASIRLV